MKNKKKVLAWVLAVVMLVANVDYVHAAEAVQESLENELPVVSENEAPDVSENEIQEPVNGANTTVESADISTEDILYSGTSAGITWSITKDGVLTIGGTYNAELGERVVCAWRNYRDEIKKAVVTAQNVHTTHQWFDGCSNLTEIDFTGFDTSNVTDMSSMFYGCSALTELDLSSWDTGNVIGMFYMFRGCSSLTSLDLSGWDIGNVTDMSSMFRDCSSLTNLDLSGWDGGNVTDMTRMFDNCNSLTALDLSGLDTGNVTTMTYMFNECNSLTSLNMSGWDTGNVTDMTYMFRNCSSLSSLDLSGLDTGNVTTMASMFIGCSSLASLNMSGCDMGNVTSMTYMFRNCSSLSSLNMSGWDTGNVATMNFMFQGCSALTELDMSGWDTGNVTTMTYMFDECSSLSSLNVSGWETGNVTDLSYMFYDCSSLTSLDLSGWDTGNVTNMSCMFEHCSSMSSLNLSGWDAENVTSMSNMFYECSDLVDLDMSGWKTGAVTDMANMFRNCSSLTALDMSGWETGNVTTMVCMFYGCSSLASLDMSGWETDSVTNMVSMFNNCNSLTTLDLSNFSMQKVTVASYMLYGCRSIEMIGIPANLSIDIEMPKTMYNQLGEPQTDIFPKYQPEVEWYYAVNPFTEGQLHVSKVAPQTYTGKAIKPQICVYDGTTLLEEKKDYTITYKNNTKAAAKDAVNAKGKSIAPTIIVKGKGNYTKTETVTFDILAKDLSDEDVVAGELVAVAGKKVQKPIPKLTYNGKKLVNKKDFTVSYPDLEDETIVDAYKAPGTYRVVVTGKGNFTGTRELTFTITGGTLMSKVKIAKIPNQTYTGSDIEPIIKVTHGKKELVKDTDYTVDYDNNIEIGKATVTITGKGDYIGTKTATFQIVGQSIAKAKVTGIEAKTYNGKAQTQNIAVTLNGQEQPLVAEKDYTVSYTKNVNAGTATMVIKGVGAYTGTIKKTFKINAYDLEADADKLLSGVPENLSVVYEKGGSKPVLELSFNGADMTDKKDYTVSYANNTKVTTAETKKLPTITVKGKGNFKGSVQVSFVIEPKQIEDMQITLPDVAYSKSKGKYVSKPVLTDSNGKKLVAGTDYEKAVVYMLEDGTLLDKNSVVEAGQTITVTVTGKGNYTGTTEATYRVTRASFKSAKITIAPQVYTGKEILLTKDDITSVKIGKDTLVYGEDYEIVEGSYKNNIKKGTASVTIKGKGNYGGEKTVKFKIVPKELIWFWRLFG